MTPRVLAGGAALLLAAAASWAGLVVSHLDGYRWAEDSLVPTDGRSHRVRLDGDDTAVLVWSNEAHATPTCAAADAVTGRVLPLTPLDGSYRREGGSIGDWSGTATFRAASAAVDVSCTLGAAGSGSGPPDRAAGVLVAVETAPVLPPGLATLGAWGAVPVSLGLGGLLMAGVAALRGVRRGAGGRRRG